MRNEVLKGFSKLKGHSRFGKKSFNLNIKILKGFSKSKGHSWFGKKSFNLRTKIIMGFSKLKGHSKFGKKSFNLRNKNLKGFSKPKGHSNSVKCHSTWELKFLRALTCQRSFKILILKVILNLFKRLLDFKSHSKDFSFQKSFR